VNLSYLSNSVRSRRTSRAVRGGLFILAGALILAPGLWAQDAAKTSSPTAQPAKDAPAKAAPVRRMPAKTAPVKAVAVRPVPHPPAKPVALKPIPKIVVPPDAVEVSPGLYRATAADGKVWMYRRSPFGVSRWPASSDPAYNKQESAPERIVAVEQGDSIRFERTTPFGKRSWVRKKTDLTADEKAAWEQQQKNPAGGPAAEKE